MASSVYGDGIGVGKFITLQRAGLPRQADDLAQYAVLFFGYLQSGVSLTLTSGAENPVHRDHGPLHANNGDVLAAAAEAGLGIALLPTFIVGHTLADGRLQTLLDN